MSTLNLHTTGEQLNALQHSVNEAREGSESVRVDKAALRNLLLDHHALCGVVIGRGTVVEAKDD